MCACVYDREFLYMRIYIHICVCAALCLNVRTLVLFYFVRL